MRTLASLGLLGSVLLLGAGCSRSHEERGAGDVPYTALAGSPSAPASLPGVRGKSMCQSDAECPGARLCRPTDGVCLPRYPDRSVLIASRDSSASANVRQCTLSALFFDFDSAELSPEAKEWLDYNAECLKAQQLPSLFVEGHADARGDSGYNAELSRRRAEAVAAYLQRRGVKTPVTVRPMGAPPATSWSANLSEQQFAWQRRVELLLQ